MWAGTGTGVDGFGNSLSYGLGTVSLQEPGGGQSGIVRNYTSVLLCQNISEIFCLNDRPEKPGVLL